MARYDFTEGNIFKQMLWFSTPILLTNLLQTSYQFIDSLWVGNLLGAQALGAVAVSGTVIFTILSFVIGVNNASLTILSQQKGKGNEEGLKNYLNAFVVTLTCLAFVLGVVGYFLARPILMMLGTPPSMVDEATLYLKINFVGILFLFGYNFIATVLRALGDSRTPLKFVCIAVLLNTVLAPLFIIQFHLGIEGAAYATLISQAFAFLYGLALIIRKKLAPFTKPSLPQKEEILLILKLGIPAGLQMMVISSGVMAIMSVVTSFGEHTVAGFGAAQRLDSLLMLPAMALGTAVSSMAGQNIGVSKWDRVHKIARYGVLYNLVIMLIVSVIIFFFAHEAVSLFTNDESAIKFGGEYLQIIAFFYPLLGINFILNGVVRASGAMIQILLLNVVSLWVLRYPLTYGLSAFFGEMGIGLGMGISFLISSIVVYFYYRYGKWKEKELFEKKRM
ncbi:MATE family efflux transporter [Priestia endophytica]|uniref:MATE family efflux transporter n=1 Tax=Priestia endophytica TaxID=135735 RepID=UPI000DCA3731|nr:MATE family efflux transporter [Priestia endophytica]RAS75886.1 MATE family efflux transporter [Priestia endophytica]